MIVGVSANVSCLENHVTAASSQSVWPLGRLPSACRRPHQCECLPGTRVGEEAAGQRLLLFKRNTCGQNPLPCQWRQRTGNRGSGSNCTRQPSSGVSWLQGIKTRGRRGVAEACWTQRTCTTHSYVRAKTARSVTAYPALQYCSRPRPPHPLMHQHRTRCSSNAASYTLYNHDNKTAAIQQYITASAALTVDCCNCYLKAVNGQRTPGRYSRPPPTPRRSLTVLIEHVTSWPMMLSLSMSRGCARAPQARDTQ